MPQVTARQLRAILKRFPWDEWNEKLAPGLMQEYKDTVVSYGKKAAEIAGDVWSDNNPMLSKFATQYVGERIVQLDDTTQSEVSAKVRSVLDGSEPMSVTKLAETIGNAIREKFDDYEQYRALRIARTEVAIAQNHGAVLGYAQAGVDEVDVSDGTDDAECAAADGDVWDLDEALANPIEHPNCERAFSPRIPEGRDEDQRRIMKHRVSQRDWLSMGIIAARGSARIAARNDPHDRSMDVPEKPAEGTV